MMALTKNKPGRPRGKVVATYRGVPIAMGRNSTRTLYLATAWIDGYGCVSRNGSSERLAMRRVERAIDDVLG